MKFQMSMPSELLSSETEFLKERIHCRHFAIPHSRTYYLNTSYIFSQDLFHLKFSVYDINYRLQLTISLFFHVVIVECKPLWFPPRP